MNSGCQRFKAIWRGLLIFVMSRLLVYWKSYFAVTRI